MFKTPKQNESNKEQPNHNTEAKKFAFNQLPLVLKKEIMKFSTPEERAVNEAVSKEWKALLSDNKTWNSFLQERHRVSHGSAKQIYSTDRSARLAEYITLPPPGAHLLALSRCTNSPALTLQRWLHNDDSRYNKVSLLSWYIENGLSNPPKPHALSVEEALATTQQESFNLHTCVPYLLEGFFTSIEEVKALSEEQRLLLTDHGSNEILARSFQAYRERYPLPAPRR